MRIFSLEIKKKSKNRHKKKLGLIVGGIERHEKGSCHVFNWFWI